MGIHLGLHFETVKAPISKSFRDSRYFLLVECAVAMIGIACWIDREMFNKLFLGYSFDFWDSSLPISLMFASYLMIALAIAVLTDWLIRLSKPRDSLLQKFPVFQ